MANLLSTAITGTATTSGSVVIGGTFANNAYNSVSSTRLMFGGGNEPNNYSIGTNLENYGGNYTKLDLRWHTGIRIGAQPGYGGVRFFSNETLSTRIMSIGETDANVRIDNNLYIGGAGGWITDLLNAKYSTSGGTLSGSLSFADVADNIRFQKGSNHLNLKDPWSNFHLYIPSGGIYSDATAYYFRNTSSTIWLSIESGNVQASSSLRAPIFYDSDDTGFYVDPNGTSNLRKFSEFTMAYNGMNPRSANSPYVDRYNGSVGYRNGTMGFANTDFNVIARNWGSGFIDTWSSPSNAPGGSSHYIGLQGVHYSDGGTSFYGFQMACAGEADNRFFWRSSWPNMRNWVEMIHSGNISSQSVNYANSAGSANAVTWGNVSGKPSLDYQQEYTFTAPPSPDGSGYVWIRMSMGGFNGGGNFVKFSISRAIGWNGASPYGGPSMDVVAYSREWHGGQEGTVITYAEHGSVPGSGFITNAGPRDLAGGGYWFYMRVWAGIDYAMRVYRGSGPIGTAWEETTDPTRVYAIRTGVNNIGDVHIGFNTNGDVYGSRFYDYNDTAYYGDFHSRSVLNSLQLGSAASDTSNLKLDVQGNMAIRGSNGLYFGVSTNNYNSWTTKFYASGSTQYFNAQSFIFDNQGYGGTTFVTINGSGIYNNFWYRNYGNQGMYNQDYGTHFYSNAAEGFVVTGSGGVVQLQFRSNHQSTLRGYVYADTSNNIGFLNNGGSWSFRTDSSTNAFIYGSDLTIGSGGAGATNIIMGDSDEGNRVIHCNSNRIGFLTQSGSWGAYLDDSTNWYAVGSMQAPIFYDSENTGYYVDPNSTSQLNTVYAAALYGSDVYTNGGWFRNHSNTNGIYWSTTGWHLFPATTADFRIHSGNSSESALRMETNGTTRGYVYVNSSNEIGFLNEGRTWRLRVYSGGAVESYGDFRAPIFYDSNDTNYYVDPNSTSVLNALTLNGRLNAYSNIVYLNEIRFTNTAGSTQSDPYTMRWISEDSARGAGLSWLEFQLNDDSNEEIRIYGNSCVGYSCGTYSDNLYHRFNASGYAWHQSTVEAPTVYGSTTVYGPTILVNNHSDNTKGYRIHNTSGSSVSAMFTNSSNQLVIGAGAFDRINLNKNVYLNGTSLGINVTPSATVGRIDAANDIVAYSSSDERLKYNITPIENAIDKVKSLTGVEFDWKPEYKHAHGYEGHDTGIIAQQVQEVIPSAVRTNDTGFLAVRYEKLIGLLVEGMKEQQAQIEELKAKLDGLTK
jgi:hypothetical protein